jgi:sulfate permease, SulP family
MGNTTKRLLGAAGERSVFTPRRLAQLTTTITAGAVAGVTNLAFTLSIAALLFAGPLAGFVANGVGFVLLGACVMNSMLALLSSRPGMIATTQDGPAVVLALVAATLAAVEPAGSATYATVVAAIALTTVATGATFLLLGQLRLGSLVRYLPYPLVGGFLAGTGWLLALGGISVMTGVTPDIRSLPGLLAPAVLPQWLPGMLLAAVITTALRRSRHALVLPGLLVGASALFYGWLWATGATLAEAQSRGWLLGPFPQQALWAPITPALLGEVGWGALAGQSGTLVTAIAISVIGLLLNVSGLELVRREEIDLNRELRAAGAAQLAAGLLGSPPGYHMLSLSLLGHRMGAHSRLFGGVVAVIFGLAFLFGAELLALVPRVVLGGMVSYLGLSLLVEWLYDTWFRLPRLDYALIALILALIAVFGILPGMTAGLAIAVALFVVAYSRVDAVKHALSGASIKSRMTRAVEQQRLLREHGDHILVVQLQGFLFFGTAHALYERLRRRVQDTQLPRLRFLLIDFRLAPRIDSTALLSAAKVVQLADDAGFVLVFTGLAPQLMDQIERGLLRNTGGARIRVFPDQDHGLEWCENQLLQSLDGQHVGAPAQHMPDLGRLLGFFERRTVAAGEYLMRQGDEPEDMFFVETGQVTAQLEAGDGAPVRLESMRGGRFVGELGFFLGRRRTAAVIADEPSTVYRITKHDLQYLEQSDPAAAAEFHQLIARLLSERVVHLIDTVDALQR